MSGRSAIDHGGCRDRSSSLVDVTGRTSPKPLASAVGVVGEILLTAGAVVLLFVGWQVWWTDVIAEREQSRVVAQLEQDFSHPSVGSSDEASPRDGASEDAGAGEGEAFAILRIPRFGGDYARPVYAGTNDATLKKGVGHYTGTANAGAIGNFALAGHRTTYGRPFSEIDRLATGDRIVVETAQTDYVYSVTASRIVDPSQTAVIAPVPGEVGAVPTKTRLTLTTCHPRYSAQQRYIVHAELVRDHPRGAGPPRDVQAPTRKD